MHTQLNNDMLDAENANGQGLRHSHSGSSSIQHVHSFTGVHQHLLNGSIGNLLDSVQVVIGTNVHNVERI